jgi:hypothetical protein
MSGQKYKGWRNKLDLECWESPEAGKNRDRTRGIVWIKINAYVDLLLFGEMHCPGPDCRIKH